MKDNKKLVISISGGGALGIGVLAFIKALEKDLNVKLADKMYAFAGTSTGSIIAAGLDYGYSGEELFNLYNENLKTIFTKNSWYKRILPGVPTYNNFNLYNMLKTNLPGKIYDLKKPIFIPVTYMNGLHVEKVWDLGDNEDLSFCVLTSCSAPTYFPVVQKGERSYCDGGMFANDPIMILEAGLKHNQPSTDFKILSFNTTMTIPNAEDGKNKTLFGWGKYIINEWVARTGESPYYEACANIGTSNIFRASPTVNKKFKMDDISDKTLNEVINIWEDYYTLVKDKVIKFCS